MSTTCLRMCSEEHGWTRFWKSPTSIVQLIISKKTTSWQLLVIFWKKKGRVVNPRRSRSSSIAIYPRKSTKEAEKNHRIFQFKSLISWKIKKNEKNVHCIGIFVDDRTRKSVHCTGVNCIGIKLYVTRRSNSLRDSTSAYFTNYSFWKICRVITNSPLLMDH